LQRYKIFLISKKQADVPLWICDGFASGVYRHFPHQIMASFTSTDSDTHFAGCHCIDIHALKIKNDNCTQQRKRNGDNGNDGGAQTRQKQEKDNDNKLCAF
jgi:hypothetical protein